MVRYIGQEVPAVAAMDRRTAKAAAALVNVTYEPLPAVIGMAAARATGAPEVYASGRRRPPAAAEGAPTPALWHGNVRGPVGALSVRRRRPAGWWPAPGRAGTRCSSRGCSGLRPSCTRRSSRMPRSRGGLATSSRWTCRRRPLRTSPIRSPNGSTSPRSASACVPNTSAAGSARSSSWDQKRSPPSRSPARPLRRCGSRWTGWRSRA